MSEYIVENISKKTVTLTDLRVEIRPQASIDLEKVAHRSDIERSLDLKKAFKLKLLHFVRRTEKVKVEKPPSEAQMKQMMQEAMNKAMETQKQKDEPFDVNKMAETIKRQVSSVIGDKIDGKLNELIESVKNVTQTVYVTGNADNKDGIIQPQVDIATLAEITQKGVEAIASEIKQQDEPEKKAKKVKLNTLAIDLAKELE